MEQNERIDPRPTNDSRKRTTVESRKVEPVERKPSLGERWREAQPTKAILIWACLASIVLTMVIGFMWAGWMTAGAAQKMADDSARTAVVQRLAPMCVAQFNLDPDKDQKLEELGAISSYQRGEYVRTQGWATMSGEQEPDRRVADECVKLLTQLSQ
jgi:hypothetical protein